MRYSQTGILKDTRPWGKMFVAGAAAVTLSIAMFASAFAAGTVYLTQSDLTNNSYSQNDASATLVVDASAPGGEALQLDTASNNDSYVDYRFDVDKPISDITELSFMTKTLAGPSYASASFAVGLDNASDGLGAADADGYADKYLYLRTLLARSINTSYTRCVANMGC